VNCVAVGPNLFADSGEMRVQPARQAVGFDLSSNVASSYNIEIFGPGGSLGTTTAQGHPRHLLGRGHQRSRRHLPDHDQ
jgi:hypothetical protein